MKKILKDYLGRPYSGIHVEYVGCDGRVVDIARCLDKNVYVRPGYYVGTCNGLPYTHPIHRKRFSSAKRAAIACWNAGGCSYNIKTDALGARIANINNLGF